MSCVKNDGLVCIVALCTEIRRLEFQKRCEETGWEGDEERQKRKFGDCGGGAYQEEVMRMRLGTTSW